MKISKKYILEQIEEFNKQDNIPENLHNDHVVGCIFECLIKAYTNGKIYTNSFVKISEFNNLIYKTMGLKLKNSDIRVIINQIRRKWNKISSCEMVNSITHEYDFPGNIAENYIIANKNGYILAMSWRINEYKDKIQRSKRSKMVEELQLMLMGIE